MFDARGRYRRRWGKPGAGDGEFTRLLSVAVDHRRGRVYALEDRNARVQVFDLEGGFLDVFGEGDFVDPGGVAVGPDGGVFVTDYAKQRPGDGIGHLIHRYDSRGRRLGSWGRPGSGPGQLRGPTGIAVDPAGMVYVADSRNQRVQVFDPAGRLQFLWGEEGKGPGGFAEPGAIALGRRGEVYVVDTRLARLQVFRRSG